MSEKQQEKIICLLACILGTLLVHEDGIAGLAVMVFVAYALTYGF